MTLRRLNLPVTPVKVSISSLGNKSVEAAHGRVVLELIPLNCSLPIKLNALVLRKFGIIAPTRKVPLQTWPHIQNLNLADPAFTEPRPIDIILGADVYGTLLLDGIRKGHQSAPVALRTVFGWVVTGSAEVPNKFTQSNTILTLNTHHDDNLNELLKRFWEQEDISGPPIKSIEDQECERLFIDGCQRHISGRYSVRLPIRPNALSTLGESLPRARQMLNALHNKWKNDNVLKACILSLHV
ncbi:uncharacterized protein LOC127286147 [Leptopilina boulardi]|uniref:uncharacterized protein LOC127286147 n=1 Tax=Leptopilina boulardi TaxID=63433 RepID=UPI0021F523B2|nr:uncharacterized protein LOC127286147 [Leptopilina boulardi]